MTAEGTTGGFAARFYGIDLLRFVAAFVVVLFHYTFRYPFRSAGTAAAAGATFPPIGAASDTPRPATNPSK